ncbi:molecular chaperone HscC [Streptococcus ovis]|uniref:molecular chaperone HscC n=1 Tax=Streptococcus ovis TaxID=82806 RepID=UPI00036EDD7B|nr:molecular chaperone HscC [Streptococcus ovis]
MILGIDLGTTNSLAAVWRDGKAELIPNHFGDFLTPSVVGFSDEKEIIVGKLAKERLMTHPDVTQSQFKRFMGTSQKLSLGYKTYSAEELSAFVLKKLVEDAEIYLGEKVEEVIISVPAYFNDEQRAATKLAGQLAGIKVERIINEPSAAALALHQSKQTDATYLIIDFGGGTLDVSVVDAFLNVIEIVTVAGDNHLGGEDFTQVIVDDFFRAWPGIKEKMTSSNLAQLYQEADKVKQQLDHHDTAGFKIMMDKEFFSYQLTNKRYLALTKPLLKRIEMPLKRVLRDAQLTLDDISDVILVGGNTKMPLVRQYLSYLLKRKVSVSINQDQAIALGCGVMAGIKERQSDIKDMVLTDICPFTLGIEIVDGEFSPIIERNTVLPSSRVETYYATRYGQEFIDIQIYQGERMKAAENLHLGGLQVMIPKNMADYESVDVRFSYDINGILEVDVRVNSTGEMHQKVFLRDHQQLSEEEIAEKRQHLASLKHHPRESERYQLLLSRANRFYEDALGDDRKRLSMWIRAFEEVVAKQNPREITQASDQLEWQLDAFEKYHSQGGFDDF